MKQELRCRECGRLLMKFENVNGYFQTKCKCGAYNLVHIINTNDEFKKLNNNMNKLFQEVKKINSQMIGNLK